MQIDHIKELIELLDQTSLHELDLETSEFKLSLKKESAQQVVASTPIVQTSVAQAPAAVTEESIEATAEAVSTLRTITSPMVGTFYSRPAPDKDAYVQAGDRIESGQVVCVLEAMKLFNDVEAEISGEIVEILVNDGDLVEYGQALFSVK